jgi:hypothetical protein
MQITEFDNKCKNYEVCTKDRFRRQAADTIASRFNDTFFLRVGRRLPRQSVSKRGAVTWIRPAGST